jgi:dUTP pyrophosphatase
MNETATIRVRAVRPGARLPFRATELASGSDLYACLGEEAVELGQLPTLIPTGIALEVPPGLDAQIRPRSGLARQGILSTFGTLDADYRGELMVALYTTSPAVRHSVRDGDRIGQLVVTRLVEVEFIEVTELTATARGEGGHGSTGR